jgi:hypothetical protein
VFRAGRIRIPSDPTNLERDAQFTPSQQYLGIRLYLTSTHAIANWKFMSPKPTRKAEPNRYERKRIASGPQITQEKKEEILWLSFFIFTV